MGEQQANMQALREELQQTRQKVRHLHPFLLHGKGFCVQRRHLPDAGVKRINPNTEAMEKPACILPVLSYSLYATLCASEGPGYDGLQLEQERRKSNGLAQALQREKEQHFNIQQQV
jgi:hypothetical protein